MKEIKSNEILNIKSLFLLNKPTSYNLNKSSNLLHLINYKNIRKNRKKKKPTCFRNTDLLNSSKLQSYLLKLGHSSYDNNLNIKKKQKNKNTTFMVLNHEANKSSINLGKNNYRILKEIFPNLSELNLYSYYPLYPFNNDDEKKYNSKILIKKENKKNDIKNKNNYYKKDILNSEKLEIIYNEILNNINNMKEEKKEKIEKDIFVKHLNFIQKKNEKNNLSRKNIKYYLEENLPLKITKINLSNNRFIKKKKEINLDKISFGNILKNKEINKCLKNNYKYFPNINNKNDDDSKYYKFIRIQKNRSFSNCLNNFMISNSEKDININNYSFSHQNNIIQSIISRNKINSNNQNNKKNFEEKGTDMNDD